MNVKYLGSALALGSVVSLGVACGDSGSEGGSGGSADVTSTATTGGTKTTSAPSSVTVTSSSTGSMADGNDTFATATPLMPDANGVLEAFAEDGMYKLDPLSADATMSDVDWYSFPATAGALLINISHGDMQSEDVDIDTFVTLYDSNMQQLARNDDGYPRADTRSQIITQIPADGTYYIKVEEFCNSPEKSAEGCDQAYFDNKSNRNYGFQIGANYIGFDPEVEPNDSAGTATPIPNDTVQNAPGEYYFTHNPGSFSSATDGDFYSITVPSDLVVAAGKRPQLTLVFPFGGVNNNGSRTKTGLVTVYDAAGTTVIAQFDLSTEPSAQFGMDDARMQFAVPVVAGTTYTVKVEKGPAETDGTADFYFIYRGLGEGDEVEVNDVTNNLPATPDVPTQIMLIGGPGYRVEGNLGAADFDYYRLGTNNLGFMSIFCDAQRTGSGARGLTATLFAADGITEIAGGSGVETATAGIQLTDIPVTGTDVILRVSKTSQDATVTGDYYHCAGVVAAMASP